MDWNLPQLKHEDPCDVPLDEIYDQGMRDGYRGIDQFQNEYPLDYITEEEAEAYYNGIHEGDWWRYNPVFTGKTVTVRTGSEGPRHDPYGYTIIIVRDSEHFYEFKMGSLYNSYIEVDDEMVMKEQGENFKELEDKFKELTGAAPDEWVDWHDRNYVEDPYGCLGDYE